MPIGSGAGRVSDLHKSAFWIYGVTAMVMREPLGVVIRHIAAAGVGDVQVRLEILRVSIVLALMSQLFLASGLYFDEVYLQPDSAERFPRRSYPADFISGLLHFLLAVGASTVVSTTANAFPAVVLAFLLYDSAWYALSRLLGFATVSRLAGPAGAGARSALLCTVIWGLLRLTTDNAAVAEQAAFALLLGLVCYDVSHLLRGYDRYPIAAPVK